MSYESDIVKKKSVYAGYEVNMVRCRLIIIWTTLFGVGM